MSNESKPIVGTGADDLVQGTDGADLLIAAAGDDRLLGLGGDDVLVAGVGNDLLDGGRGSDTLTGGHGADVFAFSSENPAVSIPEEGSSEAFVLFRLGDDVVTDFELGTDFLVFGGGDAPVFTAAELAQFVQLTEADVDADGALDTVIRIDYVEADSGIHFTDPGSSVTLLGISGASLADLVQPM
jgi:Ca2+-binding RTX toxin-like protein